MNLKEFEANTREALHQNREMLTKVFLEANAGHNSAIIVVLNESLKNGGTSDTNFYVVSPTVNESMYRVIPDTIKKRMYENEHNVYVIFIGWDNMVTSYVLIKNHTSN